MRMPTAPRTKFRMTAKSCHRSLVQKILILLWLGGLTAPAAADVYQRRDDGSFEITASDQPTLGLPSDDGEAIHLPAEAVTPIVEVSAPVTFAPALHHVAALNHLSPVLLEALIWQESRWRPEARSPAGAIGLAQLMPGTARELGVDARDPYANLAAGARYLRQQLDRFDGDVERALAAYNAGPGRVIRAGGIPAISETQNYVRAVVDRTARRSAQ